MSDTKLIKQISLSNVEIYGMLEEHARIIANFCRANNFAIMFRPINPITAIRLKQGHMGKVLNIHAKSSNYDFLAGEIPVDAWLSKASENNVSKENIEKINKQNEIELLNSKKKKFGLSCVNSDRELYNINFFIEKVQKKVKISGYNGAEFESFYEIDNSGNVIFDKSKNPKQPKIYIKKDGQYYEFNGWEDGKGYEVAKIKKPNIQPKQVKPVEIFAYSRYVGNNLKNIPITADYDQLTAGPAIDTNDIVFDLIKDKNIKKYLSTTNAEIGSQTTGSKKQQVEYFLKHVFGGKYFNKLKFLKDYNSKLLEVILDMNDLLFNDLNSLNQIMQKPELRSQILTGSGKLNKSLKFTQKELTALRLLGQTGYIIGLEKQELSDLLNYAISHGLEARHIPNEEISETDEHLLITPNKIETVKGFKNIINKINELRKEGFMIEVNPAWNIDVDFSKIPSEIFINKDNKNNKEPLMLLMYKELVRNNTEKNKQLFNALYQAETFYFQSDIVPIKPEQLFRRDMVMKVREANLSKAFEIYDAISKEKKLPCTVKELLRQRKANLSIVIGKKEGLQRI